MPDENNIKLNKTGSIARKMFPYEKHKLSMYEEYTFQAKFTKCESSPAFALGRLKSGPYDEDGRLMRAYDLSKRLGFDRCLATLYRMPLSPSQRPRFQVGATPAANDNGVEAISFLAVMEINQAATSSSLQSHPSNNTRGGLP
ncbi:hypothetical protein DFQ26_006204 [Actinomortierella ambigua]|nr:hypothetical protein DFQ26_006204 [Actinomortierella ambigua]